MRRVLQKIGGWVVLLALVSTNSFGQVTNSSMQGLVKDTDGELLVGANVIALHTPSGTEYGVVTNTDGRFILPGMRIGGPYEVKVSYVGYNTKKYTGIVLKLGDPFVLNAELEASAETLGEIVVSATRTNSVDKVGTSTNVSSKQFTTLPTISRSLTDFTRLTPQSNGTSFAGRDGRYNNIQVDGANLNNNFGLSNDPLPGGGGSPISLDAYEEVSVNIAPFDVRQSGFTGAGINAVTKSGTNTLKGTAYTFFRNQSFQGTNVGDTDISSQIVDSKTNIYGFSLGGPIIKNKLFFFVNAELEEGSRPGITFSPTGGSGSGVVSSTPIDSLRKFSDHLRTAYGYETGAFDNFPNFFNKNSKILAKLDYNINQNHRATLKFSQYISNNDQPLNGSSVPNGGGFTVTGRTGTVARLPVNRFSNTSMSFANSNFLFEDVVRTGTFELNSTFGSKISNQFLATVTRINTIRVVDGGIFPTIDIFDGVTGNNYMSAGTDPFTQNNEVVNDVITITDNFTYYVGKHTITAGGTFEYQNVGNMFMPGSNGYYIFNSLDDFVNDRAPRYFAYTYSLVPGQESVFSAELKVGQLGLYAQDEFQINNNLKLTIGVRGDLPIYLEDPIENPAAASLQFYDKEGNLTNYSNGAWPKSSLLLSPRAGARWDVMGDQSLIVRGGTGIFTGRIPFVFLTNMPTNSGMYQFGGRINDSTALASIRFSPEANAYADRFPTTAGTSAPGNLVFMDQDFKFPQVWRTNVAVDKELPWGVVATVEALVTKDINAVRMRNANMNPTTNGVVVEGGNSRPRYLAAADNRLNPSTTTAIVLENTNLGYSAAITAQLSKSFDQGFYGSVAYTHTRAEEVTANPGSQAASVWNANPNVGTSNAFELHNSQYAIPHRVVANVSYRKEYLNHFASALSIFFEGSHQGLYSFVVNGDLNSDGNNSTDLMYIPRDASEMNFEAYSVTNGPSFSVEDQEAAFEAFINNSPYLNKHRGEYAGRNGALRPWLNRMDIRFLQDFYLEAGNRQHLLQFSMDIFNFGNMVNKNWGVQEITTTNNPLVFRSIDAQNRPVYRWQNISGELVTNPFQPLNSLSSTWSMQMGLRYIF